MIITIKSGGLAVKLMGLLEKVPKFSATNKTKKRMGSDMIKGSKIKCGMKK